MGQNIEAGFATEEETLAAIKEVFAIADYLIDPHTAVGFKVYQDYRAATEDGAKTGYLCYSQPF